MPIYYQRRDAEFVDYEPWLISTKPQFYIRGPQLNEADLNNGNYFSLVGAAETVGVHAEKPYGTILADRLKIPYLNLGQGGAGMAFFTQPGKQEIIDHINRGKFLILTLMSGRQTSNSLFRSRDGTCKCVYNNKEMTADRAWELITENYWDDKNFLKNLVLEVRKTYANEYIQFLNKIDVPVILFYFSQRKPRYSINWRKRDVNSIWDKFPHLVDHKTIKKIRVKSNVAYSECVSNRGIPYILRDKTGQEKPLWDPARNQFQLKHFYYPSPEMHEDAADVLEPLCIKILGKLRGTNR